MAREIKYFIPVILLPAIVLVSLYFGGYWSFFTIAFAFGLIPVLEFFLTGNTDNLSKEEEVVERKKLSYDLMIYALVPIQYGLLVYFLYRVSFTPILWYEMLGMTIAMGIACGVLGINVGHELGHRSNKFEQVLAKALLTTSMYLHFFIEHNRGHHKNIATRLDPATARKGENLYAFYIRSIRDSWKSAWELERHRLAKAGLPFISWHNEMLRYQAYQVLFVAVIGVAFGWTGLLAFLVAALIGALLLETVNYIEHYGLERKEISPGRFEKVKPHHSWNSNHSLGRLLLFELTRHSDHHYNAGRKYQILRHFDQSPQMPTGYPGMMLCALIPPLWFHIMHQKLAEHAATYRDDSYIATISAQEAA